MILNILGPIMICLSLTLFARKVTRISLVYFVTISISLLLYVNCVAYYYYLFEFNNIVLDLGVIFEYKNFNINWLFILDKVALLMIVIITIIAFCIFIYSIDYIYNDPHVIRFIIYLYLFVGFIFILVSGYNLITIFIGWEGVGLCSYLLISFWATRLQALKAAVKAIFINKIGDLSFLIAVGFTVYLTHSTDLDLFSLFFTGNFSNTQINILITQLGIFYLIAICAKSAQIGLHTWLPAAMEGPTPVSALIHAATIVTAGIILFIRLFALFQSNKLLIIYCAILGGITALGSAITAMFLFDIKKIIAYSTCSQLGYILASCGLFEPDLGLNHLINHAFFKALLFLTAGSIIHAFQNEQDIRYLKQVGFLLPSEYLAIIVGNLCIMGVPFLTGFYSKDLILEYAYISGLANLNYVYWLLLLAAISTILYSSRLFIYLFFEETTNKRLKVFVNLKLIKHVIFILCIISCFVGFMCSDLFDSTYNSSPGHAINKTILVELELLGGIKLLPLICTICCCSLIYFFYIGIKMWNITPYRSVFLFNYYFNELYNYVALNLFLYAHIIVKNIDKGVLERIGPLGVAHFYFKCMIFCNKIFIISILAQFRLLLYFSIICWILVILV
jgi:NADH-ubiquinone oxidoreductase chain 5